MAEPDILELYLSGDQRPSHDLAFEGFMLERAAAGTPCALLASWPRPVVVLGYAQPAGDVDREWCRAHEIPVLRRISGGTGVIHRRDLALSLALPATHPWARGIVSLYGDLLGVIEAAVNACGGAVSRLAEPRRAGRQRSPICFEDQGAETLARDGRKVVGCAQARRRHAVLVHAAILLDLDAALYARVFGVGEERVREGLAEALPGGDPRRLSAELASRLARALGLDLLPSQQPVLPARLLAPWSEERWSPVAEPS